MMKKKVLSYSYVVDQKFWGNIGNDLKGLVVSTVHVKTIIE